MGLQLLDVDAGLGFGDGAVVDLDFSGFAEDERCAGLALPWAGTRRRRVTVLVSGADGDGDFGGGVSGVGDVDGDEEVSGLLRGEEDCCRW